MADFWVRIRDSGRLGWLLLALAVVAAVVLVAAEFSLVSYRTIGIGACADRVGVDKCRTVGHDAHAYALIILAVVGLAMAWGGVVGRSGAAAWATAAVGIAVLVIALAIDAPSLDDTRGLEADYAPPIGTHVGYGFKLELVGGVLLLLVGGLAVGRLRDDEEEAPLEGMPPPPGAEPEPEPADAEDTPQPEAYRPRTTARGKERERSRRRRPRKP